MKYGKIIFMVRSMVRWSLIFTFSSSFSETVAEPPSPHDAPGKPHESENTEQPLPSPAQREKKAPRPPKKKYQKAGLYSDVYKTTE